ncbi:protein mono-ADP-ribosyltransferase PARP12 isoform X2 [Antennarius striatus]|uniref:protein mono-ADP-ribosyltransferase PARP12 isoform X2 n=1 Tax=Antennarius striatus TaxID=241820 RepID=UPI0035AD77AB
MNESDILKFLCANQGSINTDDLVFNLGSDPAHLSKMISNREKFVSCCPFGQPKLVARTRLRLCRARGCLGGCEGLHLCKSVLFGGSCQFGQLRRECNFSHELDSDHNLQILKKHELENLSKTELCVLMMQSDDRLLPQICHNYNNGLGESSLCKDGYSCKRLHMCEKYMNRYCSCTRTHDFTASQPLKVLQDYGVPDDLISSLKSVYANILALKYSERGSKGNQDSIQWQGGHQGNRGRGGKRGHRGFQSGHQPRPFPSHTGGTLNTAFRGRGGPRGGRGDWRRQPWLPQTCSTGDIHAAIGTIDQLDFGDTGDTGPSEANTDQQQASNLHLPAANNTDTSSDDGQNTGKIQNPNETSTADGGSGGNQKHLHRTHSTDDASAVVKEESNGDSGGNRKERQRPVRDKTEICLYFIKGRCIHEERCFKAHDKIPYRWEIRKDDQWNPMPENETIEKDYCDPNNTHSSGPFVYFDTMTCGPDKLKVRRLSTANSLLEPTFIFTTEWVWYWEDEFGNWNMYASTGGGHKPADMDSSTLEQKFLDNSKDMVEFTAGSQTYSLCFKSMIQTNKQYGTQKVVRRRPRFVSAADVQAKRVRKPLGLMFAPVPSHWDKSQIPQTGYKRIPLQHFSEEFQKIESLFSATMTGFDVVKIERIQNKALWEVFQWQKGQMQNSRGGRRVREEKLFHGTDNKYVDTICQTNFDWRLCGTHGTAFGKGSYFAKDAKYSHSYTSDSDVKSMFVAHLLVGDYTKGSPDYRRPPSKNGDDINFFDSCVDNVSNPSIYVVFEKHQIYPEYLLQYKTTHPLIDRFSSNASSYHHSPSSFPYQLRPMPSSYQPTSLISNPISSSNQSSSSSSSYKPVISISNPKVPNQSSSPLFPFQPVKSFSNPKPASNQAMPYLPTQKKKEESSSCIIA